MKAMLTKIGKSLAVKLPLQVERSLKLRAGQTVLLEVTSAGLFIQTALGRRYTLDELLAQCDSNAPMPRSLQAWDRAPRSGKEQW